MDPKYVDNEHKELYAPIRYSQIIEECLYITKQINTSYNEILLITPRERSQLIKLLEKMNKLEKEKTDKLIKESSMSK